MVYYITIEENGKVEELELKPYSIYLKCAVCGEKYAPTVLFFADDEPETERSRMSRTCCPKCYNEYEKRISKAGTDAYFAERMSRYFKMKITPKDVSEMMSYFEGKDAHFKDVCEYIAEKHAKGQF